MPPDESVSLSKFVIEECPHLKFLGLMTIGKFGYDASEGPNPDFLVSKSITYPVLNQFDAHSPVS